METSSIILLVFSASVSFAVGRTIMHFHHRKRKSRLDAHQNRMAPALHDAPTEPKSTNKGKRKRQLQRAERSVHKR